MAHASMDAADYATAISQRYNAELYALHVIHADVDLYWPHVTSEFTKNMRNEGEKYLNKVKVKANEKGIHIKTEIISSKDISGGILSDISLGIGPGKKPSAEANTAIKAALQLG
jgi:nucleotide-binding universal stress UspA family protein